MRQTTLHRTTLFVVVFLGAVSITLGVLRNTVVSRQDGRAGHHEHSEQKSHGGHEIAAAALFEDKGCSGCHATDSTGKKVGPGLKGLFHRDRLPASGRPVNEKNIERQLTDPYKNMPSYSNRLTEKERDRILLYLKAL